MGNSSLSNEFKSGKWKRIQTIGNRQVLQNIETQIKVQKHFAMSDFKSFDDRFKNTELYNWRKSLNDSINVVKLYEYEIKQERFGIQEDQYVYTEKIHRFNQKAKILSKPQGFLLILDLLSGLDILFQTFGLFNIDVFLLGLSQSGRGKVWLNENYAKNNIDETNIIETNTQTTELVVVNNLVRLVRDKVYNQTFVPQVQFPSNMYLKGAIQYLKAVRRQHALFRVDKVYLDRDLFKQYYDTLYKQHIQIPQLRPEINIFPPNLQPNLLNPQILQNTQLLPVEPQERHLERQKSASFMKVKNEPSQTLSSDSNSRSKRHNDKLLPLPSTVVKQQRQPTHYHEKIHLKQIIEKQRLFMASYEGQLPSNQFIQSEHNFIRNEKNSGQVGKTINIQQRPSIPPVPMKNIPPQMHQIIQPRVEENMAPQFYQRPNMPMNQVPQQFRGQQLVQRKIVEYRPINNEERQNIQKLLGSSINNGHRFMQTQSMSTPQQMRPIMQHDPRLMGQQFIQTQPNFIASQPLQRQNFYQQQMGINNVVPRNMNEQREQEEQFINNVELCQSVMFDRGELERNMADL